MKKAAVKAVKAVPAPKAVKAVKAVPKPEEDIAAPPVTPAKPASSDAIVVIDPFAASPGKEEPIDPAERAILRKFPSVKRAMLSSIRDKQGRTPIDIVKDEIAKRKAVKKYLTTDFWVYFEECFDLTHSTVFSSLPEPDEENDVDRALAEAILRTKAKNPADRSTADLASILSYCREPNAQEVFGLVKACGPHINLFECHRIEVERLVVKVFAKFDLHKKHEAIWAHISDVMEQVVVNQWNDESAMGRKVFIKANADVLHLFVNLEAMLRVEETLDQNQDPLVEDMRICLTTDLGRAMYKDQGNRLTWLTWRESITKGICDLFHRDFEVAEYAAVTNLMKQQGERISKGGVGPFLKKTLAVRFLCVPSMDAPVVNVNDIWSFRVEAEMKSIALNNGQLERTAIERLVYGDAKIAGIAETIRIPDELLRPFKNVRAAAANFLGTDPMRLDKIIKKLAEKKIHKSLCNINRSWVLEHAWMVGHAESILQDNVENKILNSIQRPVAVGKITYTKVFDAIAVAHASAEVAALPISFTKTLRGVKDMIEQIKASQAPGEKEVPKYSAFHTRVLQACEQWCVVRAPKADDVFGQPVLTFGREASRYIFEKVDAAVKKGEAPDMKEVSELRRFLWMLSGPEQEVVSVAAKKGMKAYREKQACDMICDSADSSAASKATTTGDGAEGSIKEVVPLSGPSASASASSCAAAPPPLAMEDPDSRPVKQAKMTENKDHMKTAMMALFGSKAKIR